MAQLSHEQLSCGNWSAKDTLVCPADQATAMEHDPEAEITIKRAREHYHSYGGQIPPGFKDNQGIPSVEPCRPHNLEICDNCGHKCLNG